MLTGLFFVAAAFLWFAKDLPSTDGLWRADRTALRAFVAADGTPLVARGGAAGRPVRLTELPAHVPAAVLAIEDRNFHHHVGINPISVGRALLVNTINGEIKQGGSTITQQLAKNIFLSPEKTLKRKIQELLLAFWLEHRFSKDEILTLYLNRVYFGGGAYGVDAAARRYFAKPASALTVTEAAILAGLLKAPSRYAPTHNPREAGARAALVIEQMVKAGFLSREQANQAHAEHVHLGGEDKFRAPYFIDFAAKELQRKLTRSEGDLSVYTTINPNIQAALSEGIEATIADLQLDSAIEVAAVVMTPEGAIRAMVGGRSYENSQFNRAVQARRQPGSAFKPFVFMAALESGAAKESIVLDAPITIGNWAPDNYKSKFYGPISLTQAMALSLNSATLRLQEASGRNAVKLIARRMGLDAAFTEGPSLGLGVDGVSPLMLARAYSPFANGGFRVEPYALVRAESVDGTVLYQHEADFEGIAASAPVIDEVNYMLRAVTDWGTGKAARLPGHETFGKTGTSQDNRDAWFAGHAGGLICVIWVGRDDNGPMPGITGGGVPAQIWQAAMSRALAPYPHGVMPQIHHQPLQAPTDVETGDELPVLLAPLVPATAGHSMVGGLPSADNGYANQMVEALSEAVSIP